MATVKCIERYKNNSGDIIGYILMDEYNNKKKFTSAELKAAMKSGELNVINLKLTKDGRIITKIDKPSSKGLSKYPFSTKMAPPSLSKSLSYINITSRPLSNK